MTEYKEDTDEMPKMPEVTEEIKLLELEVEASENSQEDTRILTPEEHKENDEKSKRYREKNGNSKSKYQGKRVYVWRKQNPLVGDWEIHHTYPKNLIRYLNIEDGEVNYGGREFKQFSYFRYNYQSMDKGTGCNIGDSMLVKKYSLTPDAKKEEDNWKLCKAKMIREGTYDEELGKEIEQPRKERQERKRKQESNQLTEVTPIPRPSQKQ